MGSMLMEGAPSGVSAYGGQHLVGLVLMGEAPSGVNAHGGST